MATELEYALLECSREALEGYQFAAEYFDEIKKSILNSEKLLKEVKIKFEKSRNRKEDVLRQFSEQLDNIQKDLIELRNLSDVELIERKKGLEVFSITLFGRTMAGKSTLMEILTNGDGKSIGNGSQRTTRDVRHYRWNGIEVVDVPGVAAFEGKEDEEVALEAARHSDLILFLITDDAPQIREAQCLAKVYGVGKPVLGICNVKQSINDSIELKIFLKSPVCGSSKDEHKRLEELMKQFDQLYQKYYPDKELPFVVTNLNARYLANKDEYKDCQNDLIEKSNFEAVEKKIINAVVKDGVFLRKRNFNEAVSVPLLQLVDAFLTRSSQNSIAGRTYLSKLREFIKWSENYNKQIRGSMVFADSNKNSQNIGRPYRKMLLEQYLKEDCRINTFINEIATRLNREYDDFIDSYYESEDAGKAWDDIVKAQKIDEEVKRFCNTINNEIIEYVANLSEDLNKDIKYINSNFAVNSIAMESVFDYKKTVRWISAGVMTAGAILSICSVAAPVVLAVEIAGFVLEIISWFLESKEERIRKQKNKLLEKIKNNTDDIKINLKMSLTNWYTSNMEELQLKPLEKSLDSMTSTLFAISNAQRELAWDFNNKNKEINKAFFMDLLRNLNLYDKYASSIVDVARIPNRGICVVLSFEGILFSRNACNKIKDFLGEPLYTVFENDDKKFLFRQIIQKKARISIEEKIGVVHVENYENIDSSVLTRIKLAQQLTGLMATK